MSVLSWSRLRRWWHGVRHGGFVGVVEGGAYAAVCDCGWQSPNRATEKEMRVDARGHWGGRPPLVSGPASIRFATRYPRVTRGLFAGVPAVGLAVVLIRSHGERLRDGLIAAAAGSAFGVACLVVDRRRAVAAVRPVRAQRRPTRRVHFAVSAAFLLLALLSAWRPGTGVAFALAWLATVFGAVFWRGRGGAPPVPVPADPPPSFAALGSSGESTTARNFEAVFEAEKVRDRRT